MLSWCCNRLDRINQVDLPLDSYYSSGDYDGRGVHVYVLDTGVRASHYDFRGRVGDGASAVGRSFADDNGHGTHVSGEPPGQGPLRQLDLSPMPPHAVLAASSPPYSLHWTDHLVAGTVMGAIHGVAPSAVLHPVKVSPPASDGGWGRSSNTSRKGGGRHGPGLPHYARCLGESAQPRVGSTDAASFAAG